MRKLLAAVLMAAFAGAAHGEYLKGGYPACATKPMLEAFLELEADHGREASRIMLDGERCIVTRSGVQVRVLEKSPVDSTVKVRAFVDGQSADMWTDLKNISDIEPGDSTQGPTTASRSAMTVNFGPYFDPHEGGEHSVDRYSTSDTEHGFLFDPPLPKQEDVLESAAEWIILKYHRDSQVGDAVRYFSGRELHFVRGGAKYRIKLIPEGDDQVGGLLISEGD